MMKGTLTLLLIAMVALMGFASAYPTVNENLSYSFAKTVYDVQGNPSLSGTQSGAFSYCPGVEGYPSDGNTAALIQTKVVSAGGAMDMYPNNTGSTWQKVVQGGSSTLNMLALDPQDTDAELTAQVGTYQSVSFSGPYADYAASFADNAQVGTNNFCDIRDPQADGDNSVSWCGNAWIDESSTSSGAITKVSSDDVRIAEGTHRHSDLDWTVSRWLDWRCLYERRICGILSVLRTQRRPSQQRNTDNGHGHNKPHLEQRRRPKRAHDLNRLKDNQS
jgi:hypothetical protein